MPKVSIITPYYKAEKFIAIMIESVQKQTFKDWEHIIVDDGSPIPLTDLISSNSYTKEDKRVKLARQVNRGQSKANNLGFSLISEDSEYILFLDADDYLEIEMLSKLVNYLDNNPAAGAVSSDLTFIDEQGNVIKNLHPHIRRYVPGFPGAKPLNDNIPLTPFISLFAFCEMIPSATLLRRSVYEKTSGWNENLTIVCDTDLWLQVALVSEFHYFPQNLVRYRKHLNSLTSGNSTEFWETEQNKLFRHWLTGKELTSQEKADVLQAWHFREGKLLPYLRIVWGIEEIGKYQFIKAARSFLLFLKLVIFYYWKVAIGRTLPPLL